MLFKGLWRKKASLVLIISTILFMVAMTLFYIFIHITPDPALRLVKFFSVVLCLAFSVVFITRGLDSLLIALALLFTICADYFLVVLEDEYLIAMVFFNFTQVFYALRLYLYAGKRERRICLLIRLAAIVGAEIVAASVAKESFDALAFISVIYFFNLICSTAFSARHIKTRPVFFFGLMFFLLCDICVWTYNSAAYKDLAVLPILSYIAYSPFNWAWIFYVPSQMLLALCSLEKNTLPLLGKNR